MYIASLRQSNESSLLNIPHYMFSLMSFCASLSGTKMHVINKPGLKWRIDRCKYLVLAIWVFMRCKNDLTISISCHKTKRCFYVVLTILNVAPETK